MKKLKICILSSPKNLSMARNKIRQFLQKKQFLKNEISKICLAVDEACTNIIRHSYRNDHTKKININIIYGKHLKITIRDYGTKPVLNKISGTRPSKIRPGGLGVYLIKKIMDKAVYDTSFKKGTKLTLIKYADKNRKTGR